MVVDRYEFFHDGPEDLKVSPFFRVACYSYMELSNDLINVVKFVQGEVLESRELASLTINFQGDSLFIKIMAADHVLKSVKLIPISFLSLSTNTSQYELIVIVIGVALWLSWVGTVVLIVGHGEGWGDITTKIISPWYADIDHCLWVCKKVFADNITSIGISLAVTNKITISVLPNHIFTL